MSTTPSKDQSVGFEVILFKAQEGKPKHPDNNQRQQHNKSQQSKPRSKRNNNKAGETRNNRKQQQQQQRTAAGQKSSQLQKPKRNVRRSLLPRAPSLVRKKQPATPSKTIITSPLATKEKCAYLPSPIEPKDMSTSELLSRTSDIKAKLKAYDDDFMKHHNRKPSNNFEEKEPVLHLYELFFNLKEELDRRHYQKKKNQIASSSTPAIPAVGVDNKMNQEERTAVEQKKSGEANKLKQEGCTAVAEERTNCGETEKRDGPPESRDSPPPDDDADKMNDSSCENENIETPLYAHYYNPPDGNTYDSSFSETDEESCTESDGSGTGDDDDDSTCTSCSASTFNLNVIHTMPDDYLTAGSESILSGIEPDDDDLSNSSSIESNRRQPDDLLEFLGITSVSGNPNEKSDNGSRPPNTPKSPGKYSSNFLKGVSTNKNKEEVKNDKPTEIIAKKAKHSTNSDKKEVLSNKHSQKASGNKPTELEKQTPNKKTRGIMTIFGNRASSKKKLVASSSSKSTKPNNITKKSGMQGSSASHKAKDISMAAKKKPSPPLPPASRQNRNTTNKLPPSGQSRRIPPPSDTSTRGINSITSKQPQKTGAAATGSKIQKTTSNSTSSSSSSSSRRKNILKKKSDDTKTNISVNKNNNKNKPQSAVPADKSPPTKNKTDQQLEERPQQKNSSNVKKTIHQSRKTGSSRRTNASSISSAEDTGTRTPSRAQSRRGNTPRQKSVYSSMMPSMFQLNDSSLSAYMHGLDDEDEYDEDDSYYYDSASSYDDSCYSYYSTGTATE